MRGSPENERFSSNLLAESFRGGGGLERHFCLAELAGCGKKQWLADSEIVATLSSSGVGRLIASLSSPIACEYGGQKRSVSSGKYES